MNRAEGMTSRRGGEGSRRIFSHRDDQLRDFGQKVSCPTLKIKETEGYRGKSFAKKALRPWRQFQIISSHQVEAR